MVGGSEEGPVEVDEDFAFSLTLGRLPGVEIKLMHTLRSSIPDDDAPQERWAQFVGVPHDTRRNVNFVWLADARFRQMTAILEGLDYAFPAARKLGCFLDGSSPSKSRVMFAWTADQQGQAGGPATSLLSKVKSGLSRLTGLRAGNATATTAASSSATPSTSSSAAAAPTSPPASSLGSEDEGDNMDSSGLHLYGAVCMVGGLGNVVTALGRAVNIGQYLTSDYLLYHFLYH